MHLGCLHRPTPAFVPALAARARLDLMQAPASCDWHKAAPADGDALGNGQFGDCVPAADYQVIRLHRANAWSDSWKPTEAMALQRYTAMTGFNPVTGVPDDGTPTDLDLSDWCRSGIRLDEQNLDVPVWMQVDPANLEHNKLAVAELGAILLTLNLPIAAQNLQWDQAPGTGSDWAPGSWGAHRVCSGKYDDDVFTVRTWGQDVAMHPEWWSRYVLAVDTVLSREWCRATGLSPSGLDFDALRQEMAAALAA